MTATSISHPSPDSAERLAACRSVVVEMLAEAAWTLDFATALPFDARHGLWMQSRMRMTAASILLDDLDRFGEYFVEISAEIEKIALTHDAGKVRNLAARLQAAFDIELYQIKLGALYDRYVI